jgi:two-component system, LuxR family, response regulator FixJ
MSMNRVPVIHLIDSDAVSLLTLESQITNAGFRVATYRSASHFFTSGVTQGCVLADMQLDDMSGLDFLSAIRRSSARLPVLLMTVAAEIDAVIAAIRGGAAHILQKPIDPQRFHRAVTAAVAEQRAPELEARANEAATRIAALPPRCRDVLEGLVEGQSAKIIAHKLGISPRTVENHKINMLHRLGARHTAEAIRLAVEATLRSECGQCSQTDCPGESDLLQVLKIAGEAAKALPEPMRRKLVSH